MKNKKIIAVLTVLVVIAAVVIAEKNGGIIFRGSGPDGSHTAVLPEDVYCCTTDSQVGEAIAEAYDNTVLTPIKEESLDSTNAKTTIDSILETLVLNSDGTLGFVLPAQLPVPPKNIDLYATLSLIYEGSGSRRAESLLDWTTGWLPGQIYSAQWQAKENEKLTRVMLRMAYMEDLGDKTYREFAADYVELTEPLPFDEPVSPQEIQAEIQDNNTLVIYTEANRRMTRVQMTLPQGITLEVSDPAKPSVQVFRDGQAIGSLDLYGYGTTDPQALLAVDTAAKSLPMQIYAPIALSNHVDYSNGYQVTSYDDSSSRAVSRMRYQDLTNAEGATPTAPWLEMDCILSYDLDDNPLFAVVTLDPDILTSGELENWANSLDFTSR